MASEEKYTEHKVITREEYDSLVRDSFMLQCLQDQGVDNWSGYEDAQKAYAEEYPDA